MRIRDVKWKTTVDKYDGQIKKLALTTGTDINKIKSDVKILKSDILINNENIIDIRKSVKDTDSKLYNYIKESDERYIEFSDKVTTNIQYLTKMIWINLILAMFAILMITYILVTY